MARSINRVTLLGNCVRDAEQKFTPGGKSVTNFAVATNHRWKDQQTGDWREEPTFTSVVLWGSEGLSPHLTKGKQVFVEGRLQTRSYDSKDGKKTYVTEVIADDVILLGGAAAQPEPASFTGKSAGTASTKVRGSRSDRFDGMGVSEDDIAF